jgi:hypothetical protein
MSANLNNTMSFLAALGYTYFASGSNHAGEIRGLKVANCHVGVAVTVIGEDATRELKGLAGSDVKVFVDSGAFSEVAINVPAKSGKNKGKLPRPNLPPFTWFDVEPITHEEWGKRLATYRDLGEALGSQAYMVAPDKVANQAVTLERLARYAAEVNELRELGVNILVAHQKGELSLADFHACAIEILGFDDFVVAVPMAKDATTIEDILSLLGAHDISRLHLLGLGPKADHFGNVVEAIRGSFPEVEIFCDSVLITSLVGRNNGPGGGPRALTAASDHSFARVAEATFDEGVDGYDYTEMISEPSFWLTKAAMSTFVKELGLSRVEAKAARADIDEWLQEDDHYLDPMVEMVLDQLWEKHLRTKASVAWRKCESIREVFGVDVRQAEEALTAAELNLEGVALRMMNYYHWCDEQGLRPRPETETQRQDAVLRARAKVEEARQGVEYMQLRADGRLEELAA